MIVFKCIFVTSLIGLVALPAIADGVCERSDAMPLRIETDGVAPVEHVLCPEDLDRLPTASFSTTTLWTRGVQEFEGVWLSSLLQELGLSEGNVTLQAINDYAVTEPIATFRQGGALVAYRRNGDIMQPRDKGPYWLVWNYDGDPEFRNEQIYALSIWQLDRITVSR